METQAAFPHPEGTGTPLQTDIFVLSLTFSCLLSTLVSLLKAIRVCNIRAVQKPNDSFNLRRASCKDCTPSILRIRQEFQNKPDFQKKRPYQTNPLFHLLHSVFGMGPEQSKNPFQKSASPCQKTDSRPPDLVPILLLFLPQDNSIARYVNIRFLFHNAYFPLSHPPSTRHGHNLSDSASGTPPGRNNRLVLLLSDSVFLWQHLRIKRYAIRHRIQNTRACFLAEKLPLPFTLCIFWSYAGFFCQNQHLQNLVAS